MLLFAGLASVTFRQLQPENITKLLINTDVCGIEWGKAEPGGWDRYLAQISKIYFYASRRLFHIVGICQRR